MAGMFVETDLKRNVMDTHRSELMLYLCGMKSQSKDGKRLRGSCLLACAS